MAIDPEGEFKLELEVFGNEVEEAIQSFYAERTINNRNAASWTPSRAHTRSGRATHQGISLEKVTIF